MAVLWEEKAGSIRPSGGSQPTVFRFHFQTTCSQGRFSFGNRMVKAGRGLDPFIWKLAMSFVVGGVWIVLGISVAEKAG